MLSSFKNRDVLLHSQHFDTIILLLGREGKLLTAQRYFDSMEEFGILPSLASYCSLMSGYAKMGLFSEAFGLMQRMRSQGIEANEVPYNILIHACASTKSGVPVSKVSPMAAKLT